MHESTLHRWKRQDRVDRGLISGVGTAESARLREARRRIRELEAELAVVDGITASYISPKMTQRRLEHLGVPASIHVVEIAKMASGNEPRANGVTVPEECLIAEERSSSHPLPARELLDAVRVA